MLSSVLCRAQSLVVRQQSEIQFICKNVASKEEKKKFLTTHLTCGIKGNVLLLLFCCFVVLLFVCFYLFYYGVVPSKSHTCGTYSFTSPESNFMR